jgi:CheY-like chemotaxis protein
MREPNGLGQEPRSVGRILVVDDERDVCHVARVLFAADGYLVETACDVAEGLQSARSFLPDVILADLRLPDRGDGHEFARRLRLESNLPQPFLFALTGSADAEEKRSALEAGFNEVLVKPLDYGQFLDRVAVMRQQSCQKPTLALSNPA